MIGVRTIFYWLLINVVGYAGEQKNPTLFLIILAFFFYDLIIRNPVWPYPDGKVTWPWKRSSSKK